MSTENEQFELTGPEANAKGVFTENGFIVMAGSVARREIVPSASHLVSIRQRLLAEGILKEDNGRLVFVKDQQFNSPSGAAAAVLGRAANGWISWLNNKGQTLSDVKRVVRSERQLLSDKIRTEIKERHRKLVDENKMPSATELEREYSLFRERFGPSVLKGLDGEELLNYMHDHRRTNRESLVYWLEFKNDEEFHSGNFGSIAGGSALKFRIFRRKETGQWQAGSETGNRPQDITVEKAIEYARIHRDQFIRGCEILESLRDNATDEDYAELQDQLDEVAPDVSRLAWGHKYFSIMFPNKLDDYHAPSYQRFHLLKLLQMPPEGQGRYMSAGRFIDSAKEVDLSINHLTKTLNSLHGDRHRYWRIGTTSDSTGESFWQMMREGSLVAIGWNTLGELSWVNENRESREKLKQLLANIYPNDLPTTIGRDASQIEKFVSTITEGDIVVAANGSKILGAGRVVGGYEYNENSGFPHQRKVEWLNSDSWQMPMSNEGLQSAVRELGKYDENLLAIEKLIQSQAKEDDEVKPRPARLAGIAGRIQSVLDRKSQVVLYGPPGTGKTYWAERTANDLASISSYGKFFDELDGEEKKIITGSGNESGLIRLCCFHPAYGYEDFLEGYRPRTSNGNISFDLRDGIFKTLCTDAAASPNRNFFLIVDEINRGDIPRIFGELLTIIEKDKRGKRIVLPLSQQVFSVPKNVFVIGTMNTADRSISLIDAALRRRFGWVELMPDSGVLKDSSVSGIALKAWLDELNARIKSHVGRDARNLQIGHSYLMQGGNAIKDLANLKRAIRDDIIPLLEEYCYEDYAALSNILGEQLVDIQTQIVRHELFDEVQDDTFVQLILAPFAEISTSTEAISTDDLHSLTTEEADDDNEDGDDS